MGTVLRGLGARGLAACALLLLPRAPRGAYAEAHPPWPVAVHANGSVSVSADQGGIHLVPKEGHAVEVRGSLEVGGTDVYVLLQPPACDGAHQKLQHNGTAWLCVCESGWAGEGCAELDARMYVAIFVLTIAAMMLTSMLLISIGRRSIPQLKRPSRDGTEMTSKYQEPLLS